MARAREALRGITSSLLAPAALLAAALVVAVGGSGADALSSLGQLASGPEVPLSSVESVSRGPSGGADASDLDSGTLASSDAAKPRAKGSASSRSAERLRAAASGSSGPRAEDGGSAGSSRGGGGSTGGRSDGGGGGGGSAPAPVRPRAPSPGRAPSRSPAPSQPRRPNPLGQTLDQTQQQLDKLLQPVKPITDGVLGGLSR